jgi:hypothetical protein
VVQKSMHGGDSHMNRTAWVARSLVPDLALGEVAGNGIRGAVGGATVSVGLGLHRKKRDLG